MDPRVVAAGPEEVVVMWQQRGLSSTGHRFDGPVIGLYRVREGGVMPSGTLRHPLFLRWL
jgi:ketosteroid isomerase-like protein